MNNGKSFHGKLAAIAIIVCLGTVVYSNAFFAAFNYDDHSSIIMNACIKNIADLKGIWNFWPGRFLTYLSFALNYHFHRLDVFGYHLFNVGIHLVAGILVWWLVLMTLSTPAMKQDKITQEPHLIALMAALVFISHPLQTEAITYIVQRAASMASLFYLASLCFFVKSRLLQINQTNSIYARFYYSGALVMAVMAMFTKEMAMSLPLMILLYECSFLNVKKALNWQPLIPFLLTVLIIPLTIALTKSVNFQEMRQTLPMEAATNITPLQYLFTEFRVIITYIRLLVVPLNQNLDYEYHISQSFFELPTVISFLFLMGILFLAKRLFLKYRLISFSIIWFFLGLLPESSLWPIKDVIAEHRLYLPMVGYSILLVSSMYYLFGKKPMVSILLIIIACNSMLTYQRNQIWKDELTMWNDVVQKSPHKLRGYYNRGVAYDEAYSNRGDAYHQRGSLFQAITDYNKAIELNPAYADAYNNRGLDYSNMGDIFQAISDYNQAIKLNPKFGRAYINRGYIYEKQGDLPKAIADYNKALEINPQDAVAYNNRGNIFVAQGDFTQAVFDYNKAIELNPACAEAYINRGFAYSNMGNIFQAISDYNKAIELNPELGQAYTNRGYIYAKQGAFPKAIADYSKVLEINPQDAVTYYYRGNLFVAQGDFTQAEFDYNKAIAINPRFAEAYGNRAIAYYQLKKFDKAWSDVIKAETLGAVVNSQLINALKEQKQQGP